MKTWVFDLGNSRLKYAELGEDGRLGEVVAVDHRAPDWLERLPLPAANRGVRMACVASVAAPALTLQLLERLGPGFAGISRARTQSRLAGLRIAYAEPAALGVDRFLALLGAHARGQGPCLVVGIGTAVTVDLLAADGQHQGGLIAPSPEWMRKALHQAAVQLPEHGGRTVDFADTTPDALASGCWGATLGLVERSLRQARQRLGSEVTLLLHGGGADVLRQDWQGQSVMASALVLEGLAVWARSGIEAPQAVARIPAC